MGERTLRDERAQAGFAGADVDSGTCFLADTERSHWFVRARRANQQLPDLPELVGHGGSIPGYSTRLDFDRISKTAIAIVATVNPPGLDQLSYGPALSKAYSDLLHEALRP